MGRKKIGISLFSPPRIKAEFLIFHGKGQRHRKRGTARRNPHSTAVHSTAQQNTQRDRPQHTPTDRDRCGARKARADAVPKHRPNATTTVPPLPPYYSPPFLMGARSKLAFFQKN